jgi:zinc and cadmium transporter
MAFEFVYIILSVLLISTVSFVGVFTLFLKRSVINNMLFAFAALSAGTLLGASLLDLIPEALESGEVIGLNAVNILSYVLIGILVFYAIEKFVSWHHHHNGLRGEDFAEKEVHTFTYLSLFGDGIHNFLDGVIIAASFLVDIPLGIATTVAIAAHEIPQELSDFALLIYGGMTRLKALLYNFISALAAVVGAVIGYFFLSELAFPQIFLLAFAAGGFLYIATTDLIPEFHKETGLLKSITQSLFMISGILLIVIIVALE